MIERGKLRVHYFRHKEIKNLLCLINSHFIRRWELKGSVFQFQHTMKCARVPRKHCCKKIHTWPTVITLLSWEYSWIQHTYFGIQQRQCAAPRDSPDQNSASMYNDVNMHAAFERFETYQDVPVTSLFFVYEPSIRFYSNPGLLVFFVFCFCRKFWHKYSTSVPEVARGVIWCISSSTCIFLSPPYFGFIMDVVTYMLGPMKKPILYSKYGISIGPIFCFFLFLHMY